VEALSNPPIQKNQAQPWLVSGALLQNAHSVFP
jgi:hypothetical protein